MITISCFTYELYRLLAPHADVTVWSMHRPHPHWAERLPIEPIVPSRLRFPPRSG